MNKNSILEILKKDNCTPEEAEKHIKNGTTVYTMSEKETYINNCIACLCDYEEAVKTWKQLPTISHNNIIYKIDYVL